MHRIGPGSVYSPEHDRHTIRVISPLRLVCVFNPALTGRETHDADGSYLPAEAEQWPRFSADSGERRITTEEVGESALMQGHRRIRRGIG